MNGVRYRTALIATALACVAFVSVARAGVATAAPARRTRRVPPVLSYGPDPLQTVQAWMPSGTDRPVVIMVHGDGFRSSAGDATRLLADCNQLAAAGFAVFDVNYRSDSPTQPAFPTEVADVVAGTDWAIAHAAQYHGNAGDVNLVGGSAGGTLAADAAQLMPGQIHGVISLSGTNDLGAALAYWATVPGSFGRLHVKNISDALGCRRAGCVNLAPVWSPDSRTAAANCPAHWLVVNGTTEEQPVAQADDLASALRAAGCPVVEDLIPGSHHGYDNWKAAAPQMLALLSS
jgi:acetyl esterase